MRSCSTCGPNRSSTSFLAPIGISPPDTWILDRRHGAQPGPCSSLLAALGRWGFRFDVLQPGWLALGTFLLGCFSHRLGGRRVAVCALITLFGNRAEAFQRGRASNMVLVLGGHLLSDLGAARLDRDGRPARSRSRISLDGLPVALRIRVRVPDADRDRAGPVGLLCRGSPHWAFLAAIQAGRRRTGLLLKMSE